MHEVHFGNEKFQLIIEIKKILLSKEYITEYVNKCVVLQANLSNNQQNRYICQNYKSIHRIRLP